MPEVRVQLPLGACGGVRVGTGRRLLTAPTQVRFLSPQFESIATGLSLPNHIQAEAEQPQIAQRGRSAATKAESR